MRNYNTLYRDLASFKIPLDENGFGLIDELHTAYYTQEYVSYLGECIHMYLARLRTEYPAVYAITIGQFRSFEPFIDSFKDPEGYEFMASTIYRRSVRGEP